ncbi:anti-sigma-K factor rskA [Mumia flava]|uniref:Anti-sigma-K factor rskA n=1 Tax=Mumia flava TaxID=1348852 RepID=A0A0B2BF79_9ACTN|nr:anti-sigma factor [Mumia flava]PJJ57373.1 anti-sigma-K factor rskA [Mumia flava]
MTDDEQTHEPHPDLVALLRGELSNAEALEAGDHLDACEQCRAELAETAVGHALLARTRRTLRPLGAASAPSHAVDDEPPADALPPLEIPRRRWVRPVALVAAAAALVVATAGITSWVESDPETPPVAAPERSAPLEPVDSDGSGLVEMASDAGDEVTMTVETHGLPKTGAGEYYYVWLFDPTTEKMLGLGVMDPDGTASFRVPESLVGRYQVVDVSLESDDGDPQHSVTSVLRATYDEA